MYVYIPVRVCLDIYIYIHSMYVYLCACVVRYVLYIYIYKKDTCKYYTSTGTPTDQGPPEKLEEMKFRMSESHFLSSRLWGVQLFYLFGIQKSHVMVP